MISIEASNHKWEANVNKRLSSRYDLKILKDIGKRELQTKVRTGNR